MKKASRKYRFGKRYGVVPVPLPKRLQTSLPEFLSPLSKKLQTSLPESFSPGTPIPRCTPKGYSGYRGTSLFGVVYGEAFPGEKSPYTPNLLPDPPLTKGLQKSLVVPLTRRKVSRYPLPLRGKGV